MVRGEGRVVWGGGGYGLGEKEKWFGEEASMAGMVT